jgi:hypothetical protein
MIRKMLLNKINELIDSKEKERSKMNDVLIGAENILKSQKVYSLGKQCKNEYIVYSFYYGLKPFKHKTYLIHNNDNTFSFKKVKEFDISYFSLSDIINSDIYDLVKKGYKPVEIVSNGHCCTIKEI